MKTTGYLIAIEKEGNPYPPEDIQDALYSWLGTHFTCDVESLGEIDVYPEEIVHIEKETE